MDGEPRISGRARAERTPESVAKLFYAFARQEAPLLDSPLYTELCYGIAGDPELIEIARLAPPSQPPPNLLLGAAQYLLLQGAEHPLMAHYPVLSGQPRPLELAFPLFRDFCLRHQSEIEQIVTTRLTQTNVLRRCSALLPAFSEIASRELQPLALLELGASAGLNLNWDRYGYAFTPADGGEPLARWGAPDAAVQLRAELRGSVALPPLAPAIAVAWRRGVDLAPIDASVREQRLWLRALIWPEHVERHALLEAAAELAREHPPELLRADAVEALPGLVDQAPRHAALVVYATHALYQFPRESLGLLRERLRACARARPLWLVLMEGTGKGYELVVARLADGEVSARRLADCSPHGWWLRWLAPEDGAPESSDSPWLRWLLA